MKFSIGRYTRKAAVGHQYVGRRASTQGQLVEVTEIRDSRQGLHVHYKILKDDKGQQANLGTERAWKLSSFVNHYEPATPFPYHVSVELDQAEAQEIAECLQALWEDDLIDGAPILIDVLEQLQAKLAEVSDG